MGGIVGWWAGEWMIGMYTESRTLEGVIFTKDIVMLEYYLYLNCLQIGNHI